MAARPRALIQALDAGLGGRHERPETGGFLHEMRRYMPPAQRSFLAMLDAGPDVYGHVRAARDAELNVAYDGCLQALGDLRRDHMAMAARYITAQARGAAGGTGTGGTEFIGFLRMTRDETLARRLGERQG